MRGAAPVVMAPPGSSGFVPPSGMKKKQEQEQLRKMFKEIDTDGSGYLDRDEIKALTVRLGIDFSEADLDEAMAEMDDDGSGEVDFDEFALWWPKAQKSKLAQAMNEKAFKAMALQLYKAEQGAGAEDDPHHVENLRKMRQRLANRAKLMREGGGDAQSAAGGAAVGGDAAKKKPLFSDSSGDESMHSSSESGDDEVRARRKRDRAIQAEKAKKTRRKRGVKGAAGGMRAGLRGIRDKANALKKTLKNESDSEDEEVGGAKYKVGGRGAEGENEAFIEKRRRVFKRLGGGGTDSLQPVSAFGEGDKLGAVEEQAGEAANADWERAFVRRARESQRLVVESPWSQCTIECQRF